MKTVITYGTFDLFHIGHLRLLERAKKLSEGGRLIVAISTDEFNLKAKNKKAAIPYADRSAIVAGLRCVDQVIPETCWEQKAADVREYGVDLFVMGDDWRGKFDFLKAQCEVVYLPRTEGVSSSDLKERLKDKKLHYGTYHVAPILTLKFWVQRILKTWGLGKYVYPCLQKIWRAYRIPQRRRLLRKNGAEVMTRLHHLLQKNNVPYYCDYGTLIGFEREKGFLAHDDDIDISIPPETATPKQVLALFMELGYGFIHGFKYEGRIIEFSVMDVAGVSIDVFFPEKTAVQGVIHAYQPIWEASREYPDERANTLIQYDFVAATGIRTISVAGTFAAVPGNADEVLTSEYGQWKEPDTKFNTVTDRKHREMPDFAWRVDKEDILQ